MKKLTLLSLIAIFGIQLAIAQSTTYENLKRHVYTLADDSLKGRMVGTPESRIAADYIAGEFKKMGLRPMFSDSYFHDFSYSRFNFNFKARNVIAIIDGSDLDMNNEYIVVGAHYDHIGFREKDGKTIIFNGADDNASGVAAILEIARKLKDNPPARSVVFVAFDAEEQGLLGAEQFLKDQVIPNENIKLMFSVDMVGGLKYGKILEYCGIDYVKEGRKMFSVPNPDELPVKITNSSENPFIGTDSDAFTSKNIPAVYVNTGLKTPYHKPEDDPEIIDYEGLEKVTNHIVSVVESCGNYIGIEASKELEVKNSKKQRVTFGATLGIGSNSHWHVGSPFTGKYDFAANLGLYANIPIYKFIGIQPEVLFERKYAREAGGLFFTDAISVPLNLTLTAGDYNQRAFLQMGAYYDYVLRGTAEDKQMTFGAGGYNRHQFGLTFGFGFGFGRYSLRFVGKKALTFVHQDGSPDGHDRRNESAFISFGFRF